MVSEGTSMLHYTYIAYLVMLGKILNKKYNNYSLSLHVKSLCVSTIKIKEMNISLYTTVPVLDNKVYLSN